MAPHLTFKRLFDDLLSVIYPRVCEVCGRSLVADERCLCLICDSEMPRTLIVEQGHTTFNSIHERVMGHAPVERATALFYYDSAGKYANLIRNAKYGGRPRQLGELAYKYATDILSTGFFDGINMILPVPMNFLKRLKRGYNQTEAIAAGISAATGIPVGDNLCARRHGAQAGEGRARRAANVAGKYYVVHPEELRGRHILIVDDIVTTGATINECCEAIHASLVPPAEPGDIVASPDQAPYRISIMTLAITRPC